MDVMNIEVGDILRLKKVHPCGSFEWKVLRTGADIRIQCLGCSRTLFLERSKLEKKIKEIDK